MNKIKICGLFRDQDIDYANEAMPDYIGFVFAESKRKIGKEDARKFRQRLKKSIKSVGVFVNEDIGNIYNLVNGRIINLVQLHGDENENYINELKQITDVPIIKAVRVKSKEDIIIADKLNVNYLLFDTYSKDLAGGTGKAFDWEIIPEINTPYFLAGGINISNIDEAKMKGAFCLDVSSGAEMGGKKDRNKILEIVKQVRL